MGRRVPAENTLPRSHAKFARRLPGQAAQEFGELAGGVGEQELLGWNEEFF